ncbi:MAG TPA: S8 family serine peptidase [Armatimonadota bacterium]|nr:S8 family serine peptidase [Armatimonadota bacterium]
MKACARGTAVALVLALGMAATSAWAELYMPILAGEDQFDPKCAEPAAVVQARQAAATTLGSTISPDRGYYVVQFQGPVRWAWKRQAADLGAVFVDYVPRNAFAARMTAAEASRVAALPVVRWVSPFPARWKYRGSLVSNPKRGLTVVVKLFPGETLDRVNSFIRQRKLWRLGGAWEPTPSVLVRTPAAAVLDLAALPEVQWIQEYRMPELRNDQGQRYLNVSNVAGLPWGVDVWQDYGLFGGGQIVGIADTGLDTGNAANLHPDFLNAAGQPRLVQAFARGRTGDWSDSTTPPVAEGGHGTHVAGSVLGNGTMSGSSAPTHYYTGSFAGMAPEAGLVFQSVMDAAGFLSGLPDDFGQLFGQAYQAGARIHTNSWGASYYFGSYTYESFMVDDYLWRHPDMTILFAAGNDGYDEDGDGIIDATSIGQPATAKNCISVGASESYRPPNSGWGGLADYTWDIFGYFADPIASDYISDNPSGMAAFSSRGPCTDGRIKPDVVAPGTNIISCYSRGKLGHHSGVEELWGIYNDWYLYSGGTSMATPLTAGTAALVREYYEKVRGHSSPTGALVKATLINGARDLAPGQYGTGSKQEIHARPDGAQGWGRPDIGNSLFPQRAHAGASLIFHDYGMITDTGAVDIHPLVVTSASVPLAVTLVWTDAPAAPYTSSALVNDLDLTVVDPRGSIYRGNFGTVPASDRINNVERLDFSRPLVGTYYVKVSGYNLPYSPQPYALVMTGTTATTYSISGRIADVTGRPVGDAAISVEGIATSPGRRVTGSTRADGTYRITNLLPGRYRITPSKRFHEFTPAERRVDVVNHDVTGVDFVASVAVRYQIAGYVWDSAGRGVPGVELDVYRESAGRIAATYAAVTDAGGHYTVPQLDPGYYYIEPTVAPDRWITPPYRELELPNRESASQNFWLSPLIYSTIDVYALYPNKSPIASATVTVWRSDGDWRVVQTRQTNSQGFARLGGQYVENGQTVQVFREGYYYITVSKRGYTFEVAVNEDHVEGQLPVVSWFGPVTTAAFYFWGDSPAPTYSASGLARTLWDRPVPNARVTLSGRASGRVFHTSTRSNGYYYQTAMPADIYDVTVEKAGWQFTPIDPLTGWPDPGYQARLKVGPPAHTPPISFWALGQDPWVLGFQERDYDYQYPNGRQDYWAMPQ